MLRRIFIISGILGRTRDTICTKFTLLSASGATDKVKCSKCEHTCSALVQRMRDHWESCKGRKREAEADITELGATQTKMKQTVIPIQKTCPSFQKETELRITRALVAMNAPFRAVENKEFRKLLLKMNPGRSIPEEKVAERAIG